MSRQGSIYKRCGCRDQNGRKLEKDCPRLRRRGGAWNPKHGTWQYRLDLPPGSDGKTFALRRGGFATQDDAISELDQARGLLALAADDPTDTAQVVDLIRTATRGGGTLPSHAEVERRLHSGLPLGETPTVGAWLDDWLASKKRIRKTTAVSYASHVRLYLKPHLGNIRLDRLRVAHVADMFDTLDDRNELIRLARRPVEIPAGTDRATAKRLRHQHTELRAKLRYQKIVGPASKQRIRATLRAALNAAITHQLLTFNPAAHVELPSGRSPRPLVWTDERVTRWQLTGTKPSAVMVWLPAHTGAFLDHASTDRLYALYHLIAYRGLRRGEACGLHWDDVDLDAKTITIRWQLLLVEWHTEQGEPKTEAGERTVVLDDDTTTALRDHRTRQLQDRLATGTAWTDTGLVFTTELGQPLHPAAVSDHFTDLVAAASLPPIRLHDLRHGAASLLRAAGADLKEVQETLGHAQYATTADIYTSVFPEYARATANQAAQLVPRHRTPGTPRHPHVTHDPENTERRPPRTENAQVTRLR